MRLLTFNIEGADSEACRKRGFGSETENYYWSGCCRAIHSHRNIRWRAFTVLVYALASIGLYELIRMNKLTLISVPTVLAAVLLWILLIPSSASELFTWIGLGKLEITFVIVLLLLSYTVLSKNTFTFDNASFLLMATTYVAMGFLYLNETRILGIKYVFCALFVIWATDSGAYFVGKALGKRKLW